MTISLPVPWSAGGLLQFAELAFQLIMLATIVLVPVFFIFVIVYGHFVVRGQQKYKEYWHKMEIKERADSKEDVRIWRDCSLVYLQRLADGLTPHPGYGERAKIIRAGQDLGKSPDRS